MGALKLVEEKEFVVASKSAEVVSIQKNVIKNILANQQTDEVFLDLEEMPEHRYYISDCMSVSNIDIMIIDSSVIFRLKTLIKQEYK